MMIAAPTGTTCQSHIASSLNLSVITCAALIDSINPCAIAVLLILLATLMISASKKKVLLTGLFFISGLFVSYFLFGLGIFSALKFVSLVKIFHYLVGAFAIIVGLKSLKEFSWRRDYSF